MTTWPPCIALRKVRRLGEYQRLSRRLKSDQEEEWMLGETPAPLQKVGCASFIRPRASKDGNPDERRLLMRLGEKQGWEMEENTGGSVRVLETKVPEDR